MIDTNIENRFKISKKYKDIYVYPKCEFDLDD